MFLDIYGLESFVKGGSSLVGINGRSTFNSNPIIGPYYSTPTFGEEITNVGIRKFIVERFSGKIMKVDTSTGRLVGNLYGFALWALVGPGVLVACQTLTCDINDDGLSDTDFSEGQCVLGLN